MFLSMAKRIIAPISWCVQVFSYSIPSLLFTYFSADPIISSTTEGSNVLPPTTVREPKRMYTRICYYKTDWLDLSYKDRSDLDYIELIDPTRPASQYLHNSPPPTLRRRLRFSDVKLTHLSWYIAVLFS